MRGADHATWTISTVPLINVPLADFNDASSPSKTAEDQRLTFGGTWIETEWFKLGIGNFVTDRIFWTANETVLKSRILLQVRQGMQKQRTGESSFDEVGSPIPLATHPLVHAGSRQQIVQGFSIAGITVDGTYPTIDVHFDDGAADSYGPMTVIRQRHGSGHPVGRRYRCRRHSPRGRLVGDARLAEAPGVFRGAFMVWRIQTKADVRVGIRGE